MADGELIQWLSDEGVEALGSYKVADRERTGKRVLLWLTSPSSRPSVASHSAGELVTPVDASSC